MYCNLSPSNQRRTDNDHQCNRRGRRALHTSTGTCTSIDLGSIYNTLLLASSLRQRMWVLQGNQNMELQLEGWESLQKDVLQLGCAVEENPSVVRLAVPSSLRVVAQNLAERQLVLLEEAAEEAKLKVAAKATAARQVLLLEDLTRATQVQPAGIEERVVATAPGKPSGTLVAAAV